MIIITKNYLELDLHISCEVRYEETIQMYDILKNRSVKYFVVRNNSFMILKKIDNKHINAIELYDNSKSGYRLC